MLHERLEWLRQMRGVTKRRMAEFFDITEQTYGHMVNRPTDPPFSVVATYGRRLMVSLDWLSGLDVPTWSDAITRPIAKEIVVRLGEYRNYGERTRAIIRVLHGLDKAQFNASFIAFILRSEVAFVESILNGIEEKIPLHVTGELLNVFGLNHEWMHTGVEPPLR